MQNNPYGAYAAHSPVRFPAEVKPGVFNIWGISGYTGNVSTETGLDPEQTYCNLAKIQQSMTGHNQFDPFKFSKTEADTKAGAKGNDDTDSTSDSDDDSDGGSVERPPTPPSSKPKTYNYATYCPAPPDYGTYNFGIASPPCPPTPAPPKKKHHKKSKKDKGTKEDNNCQSCAGVSGHPVKKITKLGGRLLCWACVWGMYMHGAKKVWEESEEVKADD